MTTHAMFLLYVFIGLLGFIINMVREANNHISEWKHSSIDLPDDLEEKTGKLLFWKILNKVISLVFQLLLYAIFWPVMLSLFIVSKLRSQKQDKDYQETKFFEE